MESKIFLGPMSRNIVDTAIEYSNSFKNALCIFPFFVCVWFNSESGDKLLDPVFPIKFMKNLMKYYNHYFGTSVV